MVVSVCTVVAGDGHGGRRQWVRVSVKLHRDREKKEENARVNEEKEEVTARLFSMLSSRNFWREPRAGGGMAEAVVRPRTEPAVLEEDKIHSSHNPLGFSGF